MMSVFSDQIVRLVTDTEDLIDLSLFPNLRSLTLNKGTKAQLSQIRSNSMPNIVFLSLSLRFYCSSPVPVANTAVNNSFSSSCYPNLTRLDMIYDKPWSMSWCPQFVSLECSDPIVLQFVINLCSQLHRLKVKTYTPSYQRPISSSQLDFIGEDHRLKKLILSDSAGVFSLDNINRLLTRVPHVEYVNLSSCSIPFINLAHSVSNRLVNLRRFDCQIIDLSANNEIVDIESIRLIHPCFNRIQFETHHHDGGRVSTVYSTRKNR